MLKLIQERVTTAEGKI